LSIFSFNGGLIDDSIGFTVSVELELELELEPLGEPNASPHSSVASLLKFSILGDVNTLAFPLSDSGKYLFLSVNSISGEEVSELITDLLLLGSNNPLLGLLPLFELFVPLSVAPVRKEFIQSINPAPAVLASSA
jgi:hypothetical protein